MHHLEFTAAIVASVLDGRLEAGRRAVLDAFAGTALRLGVAVDATAACLAPFLAAISAARASMADLALPFIEVLWLAGLAAIPVILVVEFIGRAASLRPATRHALWCGVVLALLAPLAAVIVLPLSSLRDQSQLRAWALGDATASQQGERSAAPDRPESSKEPRGLPEALRADVGAPAARSSLPVTVAPGRSERAAQPSRFPLRTPSAAPALSRSGSESPVQRVGTTDQTSPARTSPPPGAAAERAESTAPASSASSSRPPHSSIVVAAVPSAAAPPRDRTAAAAPASPLLDRVLALRNALASLPRVPPLLWLLGVALLLSARLVQVQRMRRLLRETTAAPEETTELVVEVAQSIGLSTAPTVLFTDAAISPMVWCGVRPRLVLPRDLWEGMDDVSRRAVVVHELAHLRRRDHRLCWLEWLVGVAYWWHPVVWWARRRLHDEAEASCDAWVIALMPTARRAYAEALVHTNAFLSTARRPLAREFGPALAVVSISSLASRTFSGPSRKLSRRIVMVMTQRSAPRPTRLGTFAALSVVALSAAVAPVLACPPTECEDTRPVSTTAAVGRAPAAPAPPRPPAASAAPSAPSAPKPPDAPMAPTAPPAPPTPGAFFGEAAALDAMRRAGLAPNVDTVALEAMRRAGLAPTAMGDVATFFGSGARTGGVVAVLPRTGLGPMADVDGPFEGTTPRTYRLPSGKLAALKRLMERDDVPVWIECGGDHLVVHATPVGHEVFAAFVAMIHPEARAEVGGVAGFGGPGQMEQALRQARMAQSRAIGSSAGTAPSEAGHLRELLRNAERQYAQLERETQSVERDAERAAERAEAAEELAATLREQLSGRVAEQLDEEVRRTVEQALAQVRGRDQRLRSNRDTLTAQLASKMERLAQLEAQVEALERQLEALETSASAGR